jgi:hypothetical protein
MRSGQEKLQGEAAKRKPGIAKASPGSSGKSSLAVLFTRPQAEQIGASSV